MGFFKGLVEGILGRKPDGPIAPHKSDRETFEAGGVSLSISIVPPTPEQEAAWEKKREATALMRAGDTGAAVKALEEAQTIGGERQSHDEIRRAKYLQKDGRPAEAWMIYLRMIDESNSAWIDVDVLDAMRLHLQRDGQAERAIHFGIAHRLARISLYRDMKQQAEVSLNGPIPDYLKALDRSEGVFDLWERQKEQHRWSVEFAEKWIGDLTDSTDVTDAVTKLAKKAKMPHRVPELVESVFVAIESATSARDYLRAQAEIAS